MALKHKINKTEYEALSDEFKNEYVAGDKDGEYVLDVTGLPEPEDVGPIKRARDQEKAKAATLKAEVDRLKAQIAEFPDVEKLKADHDAAVKKYKDFTEKALIDGEAMRLADKISTAPKVLAPHIRERLVTDLTGDEPVTKVLKDGKPSDMTLDQLAEEFVANGDFKAIIKASSARGGGAPLNPTKPGGGGAPTGGKEDKPVDLSALPGKELAERIKERKTAAAQ